MDIFGFWLFLATIVIATTWWSLQKHRTKHDTLKLLLERGEHMTPDVIDKILGESNQPTITIPVSMKLNIVGIITMFAGLGLIGMSYFIGLHDEESRLGLLATGTLVILISIGVLFASLRVKKHIENIEDRALTDTAL